MYIEGPNKRSIFELGDEFVAVTKKYHQIVDSTWEDPRRRFRKRKKEVHLRNALESITGVLLGSYRGVMFEVFRNSNPHHPLTDDTWQSVQDATWLIIQDSVITMKDSKTFYGVLWAAYIGQMRDRPLSMHLKAKFMMLPFVDCITKHAERSLLMRAYGFDQDGEILTKHPLLDLLGRSFSELHVELLARSPDLMLLTDGVADEDTVKEMAPPFGELRRWILGV